MFITYMAAAFIALLGIGLILLLISSRDEKSDKAQYRSVMSFAFIVFAQCGLYFFFYFRDMVIGNYVVVMPLRIADYAICGAVYYFWIRVIDALGEHKTKNNNIMAIMTGVFMGVPGIIATSLFMDEYYCFEKISEGRAFLAVEAVCVGITIIVTSKLTLDFVRNSVNLLKKIYIPVGSIALMIWSIQQIFIDGSLYMGVYKSAWVTGNVDTTGAVMFVCGLATFIYLFRADFSPRFYMGNAKAEEGNNLELTAEQHGLTVRELEVLRLVYKGKNNPEIADELCISRNTVKKHMQSIYEKTGTASRMELAYLINMKNNERS
ncbi:MAG: helix-turn-helix transcriptional regulator [Clostridia bacterium]|nr:helix-turn-helix transcriptional regulator [Clostridia bacterium]